MKKPLVKNINILNKSAFFLLFLFLVLCTTISVSINKGFDFTDEGGFLLSYKNTDIYKGGIYNYHIIINNLTSWLNPGILTYRWLSVVLTFLSSIFLSIGLVSWLNFQLNKKQAFSTVLLILCFISIGNFIFYSPGILTIYNNTLTNFILQSSTGIVLILSSKNSLANLNSKKSLLLLTALGVLCSFSFFIKFPTGILQILTYSVFLVLYHRKLVFKQQVVLVLWLLFGVMLGAALYFLFFQNFPAWISNFKIEYEILSDHSTPILLKGYLFEFYSLIIFLIENFWWLILIPLMLFLRKHQFFYDSEVFRFFKNSILIFSIFFFLFKVYELNFFRSVFANKGWNNAYFYIIIILLQIAILLVFIRKPIGQEVVKKNVKPLAVFFLLVITPFIGAFGTANPLFSNCLIHSAPWFAGVIVLSIFLFRYVNKNVTIILFMVIPALVSASQIIDGILYNPYYSVFNSNKSNFFDQKEKVEEISLLNNIYVDDKTKVFLTGLKKLLKANNYRKGYPILGFHIPGVVYLMEGSSPAVPYYYNKHRDLKAFDKLYHGKQLPVLMFTQKNPIKEELLELMKMHGVFFPDDYKKIGEIYFPNENSMLMIYFPKHKKSIINSND